MARWRERRGEALTAWVAEAAIGGRPRSRRDHAATDGEPALAGGGR
jgi:hypothetical protein